MTQIDIPRDRHFDCMKQCQHGDLVRCESTCRKLDAIKSAPSEKGTQEDPDLYLMFEEAGGEGEHMDDAACWEHVAKILKRENADLRHDIERAVAENTRLLNEPPSARGSTLPEPTEAACKAVYWRHGKDAQMDDEELSALWEEDKEKCMASYRADFALLATPPAERAAAGVTVPSAENVLKAARHYLPWLKTDYPDNSWNRGAKALAEHAVDSPIQMNLDDVRYIGEIVLIFGNCLDRLAAAPQSAPPEERTTFKVGPGGWIDIRDGFPGVGQVVTVTDGVAIWQSNMAASGWNTYEPGVGEICRWMPLLNVSPMNNSTFQEKKP